MSKAPEKSFEGERIAKVLARAGLCSRRDAERWIADGRVKVNGETLTSAARNVKDTDSIVVDGNPLPQKEKTKLWRYHKPAGLVTTHKDEKGRPTVFDELKKELPRVVSVGRLDLNSEGLLLLTNDGELARELEHPSRGWVRRYRVRVHGRVPAERLDELKNGVTVEGVRYGPIQASLEREQGAANAWLVMSLTEGKNREVRKVLAHLGLTVTRLIRVSYGPFQLGHLERGQVEEVTGKVLQEQLGRKDGAPGDAAPRETLKAKKQVDRKAGDKKPFRKRFTKAREERESIEKKPFSSFKPRSKKPYPGKTAFEGKAAFQGKPGRKKSR
ncbi:MAG: rRNA pseudouridine synthase [Rhodospirillaceae bacterium]|nr:rRNA pseudouridine synthase [Rhodospirillaceae bacterium]